MRADAVLLHLLTTMVALTAARYAEWETVQPYCEIAPIKCIEGRHDDAFMPYYDSKCYCDSFCFRSPQDHDCCPDYDSVCVLGSTDDQPPPPPPSPQQVIQEHQSNQFCMSPQGQPVPLGQSIIAQCNKCTCQQQHESTNQGDPSLVCEQDKCANDPTLLNLINNHELIKDASWTARAYDRWQNKKLKDLKTQTLGTIMRSEDKRRMDLYTVAEPDQRIYSFEPTEQWTARDAGWVIGDVKDQQNCGSSWALSAVDVAADRLTRDSESRTHVDLSLQFVLSCTHRTAKEGCRAGRIDHAWGFLKDVGTLTDNCYPYESGINKHIGECQVEFSNGNPLESEASSISIATCPNTIEQNTRLYKFSPAYKVADDPKLIKYELFHHGPVQATMLVCPDFYQYSHGIYRRLYTGDMNLCDYHSIRLIGWGRDTETGTEYWTCINSWGREWGENGMFKIANGDSNINDFIVATWGRKMTIV